MRKFKIQNHIILGLVFFLIILLFPFLSYTRNMTENPNRQSSQNEVRRVNLKEVMRFSDAPEKEIYFKRPSNIKLDDYGNIYIQDNPHILKFGPDGKFLIKLIGEGQGPGELQDSFIGNLSNFALVGNKVIAFSSYPFKVMWFNEKGEFQKEKRYSIAEDPIFLVTPTLNLYVFETIIPSRNERPNIGSFQFTVRLCRISPDFQEAEVLHTWQLEGRISERGAWNIRRPIYAVIDSKTLIVNMTDEYKFVCLDLRNGKKLKTFTHKYKRVKLPKGKGYLPDIRFMHYVYPELWVVTWTRDEDGFPLICTHDLETGKVEEFFLRFPKSDSKRRYSSSYITLTSGFIFTIEQTPEGFYNIVKYRIEK